MSRPIKFRAWDKDYKYMTKKVMVGNVWDEENYHAHMLWVDPEKVDYECEPGWRNFDENSNIVIMQYTGLKDKNGVEIYEGDIIQRYNGSDAVMMDKFTVKYDDFYTGFLPFNRDEGSANRRNMEIIGNTYEHPHLMEVE